jgi:transposase
MERKDKRMHPEDVGAGSSGGKRRRHVLTIQQKVQVLRKIDRGISVSRLHREYGVGQSTIYDIKAQKDQILQFVAESDSMAGIWKRKTIRGPNNTDLDKMESEWFHQHSSEGIPISGLMLMEKTKSYHEELKIESGCDYSTRWLQKFKNCHGIRYLKISGEKLSANHELAEEYVSDLSKLVQEHTYSRANL